MRGIVKVQIGEYRQQIEVVIELTREMLSACQREEWERFYEIEPRRRCEIKALFVSPPVVNEVEYVAAGIHQVLEMDQKIISILETEKRSCADQLTQMNKGRQVNHAYKNHQNTTVGWSEHF